MGSGVGSTQQMQSSPQLSKDEELGMLKEQSQKMKDELEMIQKKIDDLIGKKE